MKKRILLVEDEQVIRETLTDLLKPRGYAVKSASDGLSALETMKLFRPHLIISDVMMAGMNGIELLEKIKTNIQWNDIPVVLLTAKREFPDRIFGLKKGADAYIPKPFDFYELNLVVNNLLSLKEKIIMGSFQHQKELGETTDEAAFCQKLNAFLETNYSQNLSLDLLATRFRLSASGFKKKLKRITGKTVQDYIREFRLDKSRQLLTAQEHNISEVAFEVGFKSASHFSDAFRKHFGTSPSKFLTQGEVF